MYDLWTDHKRFEDTNNLAHQWGKPRNFQVEVSHIHIQTSPFKVCVFISLIKASNFSTKMSFALASALRRS